MTTQAATITETPVDLIASLSLAVRGRYRLDPGGNQPIFLHVGPAVGEGQITLTAPLEMALPVEGLWAWTRQGHTAPLSITLLSQILGPFRDRRLIAASTAYENAAGFAIQAQTAGNIVFVTLDGEDEITQNMTAGDYVSVAGTPVLCKEIKAVSVAASLIGLL